MIARRHVDPELDPQMAEIAMELNRVADEEFAVMEAASKFDAPGLDQVESTLERVWIEEEGARRRRRFRVLGGVVAAAAAAALWLIFARPAAVGPNPAVPAGPGAGPGTTYLGAEDLEILHPSGDVTDWNIVEWSGPDGARYVLSIRNASDGSLVYGPQHTMERRQTLSADITSKWPDELVIELEMRRGDGTPEFTETTARKTGE